MKPDIKAAWVADLRAHPEAQGKSYLTRVERDGRQLDCCWGRLCKIMNAPSYEADFYGVPSSSTVAVLEYGERNNSSRCYIPAQIMMTLDLNGTDPDLPFLDRKSRNVTLASCNDDDMPFAQIADLIEYFL